jgi:transposase
LESAVPPARKRPEGRPAPKLGEFRELIDSWLTADLEAPRKQRHTAKRIHERLVGERYADVSERQVRRYVRERRRALGVPVDEVFVPLCHEPGAEAEVDWGRANVVIAGGLTEVFLFLMRACFSGACFVQAFGRETQQAFLEAHVAAFEFFGGCFQTVRYDNLSSAVAKVLKGRRRTETDSFSACRPTHGRPRWQRPRCSVSRASSRSTAMSFGSSAREEATRSRSSRVGRRGTPS